VTVKDLMFEVVMARSRESRNVERWWV
jgi:hypothetical protein